MGLRDTFGASRSQLLLTSVLPAVHQAYNLLLQDETQRLQTQSYHNDTHSALMVAPPAQSLQPSVQAHAASSRHPPPRSNSSSRSRCTHCGIPTWSYPKSLLSLTWLSPGAQIL
ncbi:unnamed protein product [Cuscuta europaea]|uniref:Uncharacterized protein n=1 Tax=Cuscuta europaea TaxID=41803 RepID=A0A9P0ZQ56_CUSEU|nr:unnamed protein product [Cuscuta europaea]